MEKEKAVLVLLQVCPYGVFRKAAFFPPLQGLPFILRPHEGPVEDGQEKAVQGSLLQGRGRLYPGDGMGVKEGL
jgi:hypothetical protein